MESNSESDELSIGLSIRIFIERYKMDPDALRKLRHRLDGYSETIADMIEEQTDEH